MAYSWSGKVIKGDYIEDLFFSEVYDACEYIKTNHCSSDYSGNLASHNNGYDSGDYSSVNGSYAGGCSSNNSSVESTKYSSKCVNSYNRVNHSGHGYPGSIG